MNNDIINEETNIEIINMNTEDIEINNDNNNNNNNQPIEKW